MLICGPASFGEKYLGVRVFWKIGKVLKSAFLAVTAYNPLKIEG
jgi:hypothetical protein